MLTNLQELGLNADNCVVIGSGIMSALGIRESNDIDVITNESAYGALAVSGQFEVEKNHGHEVLADGFFEIRTVWGVLGKDQTLADLMKESVVIENVRYVALEFLLRVKQSWLRDIEVRQKDIDDVELIQKYLTSIRD